MKVLKKGSGQKGPWTARFTCKTGVHNNLGCGAELQVEESDVFYSIFEQHCERWERWEDYYFVCCECGTVVRIPDNNVPYSCDTRLAWAAKNGYEDRGRSMVRKNS